MERWQVFELECTEYLNRTYGNYFTHMGFSDSTVSDIKYEKDGKMFFVEAKMPTAQSGQFVLLPDFYKNEFVFSARNKSKLDEHAEIIINYMNNNFFQYADVGSKGENIELSQELFNNWIINSYKNKNVSFIITKGVDFIIFPIEQYGKYFEVSCKFRAKKSGSRNVPKRDQDDVISYLKCINIDFELLDGFLIKSIQDLNNFRFSIRNKDYMIRNYKDNLYRIRRLSSTKNSNVIFNINLIEKQDMDDLKEFISKI